MELPYVSASETITSTGHNDVVDRVVNRYDDVATRTSENSSPTDGDIAFMEDTGDVARYFDGAWHNLLPTGAVLPYSSGTVPPGFLLCQGAQVSRTTYPALNALYASDGYPYGAGDGSTTFHLPNLRQRFPIGVASSGTGSTLGGTGGTIDHLHTVNPANTTSTSEGAHTHTVSGTTSSNGTHTHATPSTTGAAEVVNQGLGFALGNTEHIHDISNSNTTLSAGAHTHTWSDTSSSNGAHTHDVNIAQFNSGTANPPFIALHYIVKY